MSAYLNDDDKISAGVGQSFVHTYCSEAIEEAAAAVFGQIASPSTDDEIKEQLARALFRVIGNVCYHEQGKLSKRDVETFAHHLRAAEHWNAFLLDKLNKIPDSMIGSYTKQDLLNLVENMSDAALNELGTSKDEVVDTLALKIKSTT